MPTVVLFLLGALALGLFIWILAHVRRAKTFATSDAIALLGLVITVLLAVLPLLVGSGDSASAQPAVSIDGPDVATLGQQTFFTIVSANARRGEWSASGFADGQVFEVNPLPPSHRIFVAPSDPGAVGQSFTLAVTVYAADEKTASATKKFVVVAP